MGLATAAFALASQAADFATSTAGHDHLPGGWVDYVISGVGAVIVVIVIFNAIRYFVRPRENEPDHIKRKILQERG